VLAQVFLEKREQWLELTLAYFSHCLRPEHFTFSHIQGTVKASGMPSFLLQNTRQRKEKKVQGSTSWNKQKCPPDNAVFIAQHLENSNVSLTPRWMVLAFLKRDSEVLLQNTFIPVHTASRVCDYVVNQDDTVEIYKILLFKSCWNNLQNFSDGIQKNIKFCYHSFDYICIACCHFFKCIFTIRLL